MTDASHSMLMIEYVITDDFADGQPLPPLLDCDFSDLPRWAEVRRLPGSRTLWRKVTLQENHADETPSRSRGLW